MKFRVVVLVAVILIVANVVSAQQWFKVTELAPKTWVVDDHGADNIYLAEGTEKALLIDTGLGAADLAAAVKKLTSKPVIVVNTHGHPDHSGANYQFEKVYMHRADVEDAKMFASAEQRKNAGSAMLNGQKPAGNDLYRGPELTPEYVAVNDGFEFDLGDRKIRVMETPGHTPGSICLVDAKYKILFAGDTNNMLVWLFLENCRPLSVYLKTLEKQAAQLGSISVIYPGHGMPMDAVFINDQVACVKSIINKTCQSEPYDTFAGEARLCSFGDAKVAYNPANL